MKRSSLSLSLLVLMAILIGALAAAKPALASDPAQIIPAGDPADFLGRPSGSDPFDNANNWTLFNDSCFRSEIRNGQFVMTSNGRQGFSCWEQTWPDLLNFYVDVEVEMPQSCDKNDRFGLIFRAPDTKAAYLYGITCGGQFTFTSWDGQQTQILLPLIKSEQIDITPGSVNRLGVGAINDHFYFFVNGQYLSSTYDELFLEAGKIGFFVRAASEEPFTARFDNLRVWGLDDDLNSPESPGSRVPGDPISPPSGTTGATVTANTGLNIRSGPSMLFPILTTVLGGTQGQVMGVSPDGAWWAVRVPTTMHGSGVAWTARQFTTLSNPRNVNIPVVLPPAFAPGFFLPQPNANQPQVTMIESAVVRSGPSLDYPVFGVATLGTPAIVIGRSADDQWWAISMPRDIVADGIGWVFKSFTASRNTLNMPVITPPPPPQALTPLVPTTLAPSVVAVYSAEILAGPGASFNRLGRVNPGAKLAAIGVSEDGQFFAIQLPSELAPNGRGWIRADLVNTYNVRRLPTLRP